VAAQENNPQWLACLNNSEFAKPQFDTCALEATKSCFPTPFDQTKYNRCYDQGRTLLSRNIADFEQRMTVEKSEAFMKLLRAGLEYSDRQIENECDYTVATLARPGGGPSGTPESLRAQCTFYGTAKTYWRIVVHGQAR
jgi:hypothetical protein